MGEFVKVAEVGQIQPGNMIAARVENEAVLVTNVDGQHYAVSEDCTHMGGMLSAGELDGCYIICPIHSSRFDVRTGEAVGPPATEPLKVYQVRVVGTDIEVASSDE